MVYIDKFHFSPFEINDNVVSICNGEWIVKKEKIFKGDKEISPDIFYDEFIEYGKGRCFTKDFIQAYEDKKAAIPGSIAEFALYCEFKFISLGLK
jgi:hypothetical protein